MERQSILIVLACMLCMCASLVAAKDPVTISVSGTGSVTIPPEYVSVSVGVETQATTASDALQANNELATSATAAVTGLGIDDDDLETSSVSLNPVTTYNNGTSTITGFRASNTLSVTVRSQEGGDDLDTLVGEVLTELVNQGINSINDVTFKADNTTEAANAARTMAVDNAFDVASVFAKAACYEIAGVADMNVNDRNNPQPVALYESDSFGSAAKSVSTPISSGDITVSSSVYIDYFIEKMKDCDVTSAGGQ